MRTLRFFAIATMVVFLFLSTLPTGIQSITAKEENPLTIEKVVGFSTIPGTFRKPTGIVVAKDGTIYIADYGESQIDMFDSNLKPLRSFGSVGSKDGQFQEIKQIRIDENDNIYVLDSYLCRIQVFTKDGKYLKKWGEKGTKINQLYTPNDFILLNKNEILVADSSLFDDVINTIKVFTLDGKYLRNFFQSTKYTNQFNEYNGLTIDSKGFIYIDTFDFDYIEYRYMKFSQEGEYISEFIKRDYKNEESITSSLGCKVINGQFMYLTDDNAVKKFEIQSDPKQPLKFIELFLQQVEHDEDVTRVLNPSGMFFHQGKIFLVDYYHNRIAVYNEKKQRVGTYQSPIMEYGDCYRKEPLPTGLFSNPRGIAIGPDENIYVANSFHNEVDIYNYNWEEIGFFGFPGTKTGSMDEPFDLVFDQMGFCYVSDKRANSIEIYNQEHKYHSRIKISDGDPVGIAINASGILVICVSNYPADMILLYDISKMDSKKATKRKTITLDSYFYDITDVVIDEQDMMIVSMMEPKELVWVNTEGEIVKNLKMESSPRGIFRDGDGNLYVTFADNGVIQKITPDGKPIWQQDLGWYGLSYMAMDQKGTLFVSDILHNVFLVLSDKTATPPQPLKPEPVETNAKFSFTLKNEKILEEDTVVLRVMAEELDKASQLDFGIQYPPEILMFLSVEIGSVFEDTNFRIMDQTSESGVITLSIKSRKGEVITDSGVLLELSFTALAAGTGTFDFSKILLTNALGTEIHFKDKTPLPFTVIALDKTPPVLTLQPIPQLVYEPSLLIRGQTEPEATVTINQKPTEVKPDGTFESTVDLQKGKNKIKIMASDKAGNKTEQTLETTLQDKIIIKLYVGSKVIIINGNPGSLDSEPYIDKNSGRTMVPLRAIGEAIGAIISFDASTQRIDIKKDATIIQLWIGKPKAMVNGVSVSIDPDKPVSPVIVKGRTFLPLRFIAEQFEFKVEWDATTQRITLTYPKE